MNTEELYSRLQSEINLVSMVKNYILLHEGRRALKGNCPLHTDNQSLMVMPGNNIFKCFGCGIEGGPVEFYAMINNQSKQQAIATLAEYLQPEEKRSA